jgi:phosphoribosylamine--glycine ligase
MNVLILGSGGREHAFAWKIAQSPKLGQLYIAPGNAGTSACGTNVNLQVNDFESIKKFVWENDINMVVVGPEDPLVNGIHDFFLADAILKDIPVIGPKKDGAQLEGSKDFSKQFMMRHGVPTARYASFTAANLEQGKSFLKTLEPPYVLKADGLAAGKGVLILDSLETAEEELANMLGGKFGNAGNTVVIEEFLNGIELSVFVLTDGVSYKLLPAAKDYKRIGEGDTGLNTGGMGAISPVPFADKAFLKKVEENIVQPTIKGLREEGIDYRGFVFIGLMNCKGNPFVIEYNCRMGDPETEAVLPRINSDLLDLLEGVANQSLSNKEYTVTNQTAATVVMVSGGYPEDYIKGKSVSGLDTKTNSLVFHAGTKPVNDSVLTSGGRVFAITTLADNIEDAVSQSLSRAEAISYDGKYYRKDIGQDLIKWMKQHQSM